MPDVSLKNEGPYEVTPKGVTQLSFQIRKLVGRHAPSNSVEEAWTDYLSWLTFANAGMMMRGAVYCMDGQAAQRNVGILGKIVE